MSTTVDIPDVVFTGPSQDLADYHAEILSDDRLRPGSIVKRMRLLVRVELALGHPLIEATSVELREWLDRHKLQARSRYCYISHLASFWRWAIMDERADRDPTQRLTRPRLRQGVPRPISTEQLFYLVDNAPSAELRAMVTLGGYAGLRCMEIAGIEARDIMEHAEPPVLVVANGKGGKTRVIPMAAAIIEALHAHGIPRNGPIFRDRSGDALKPFRVSHLLRDYMHDCGIEASAHQLRHTFGSEMYRRSNDLRMVQTLLGHSNPNTTAGYCAWNQDKAAGVVATLFT